VLGAIVAALAILLAGVWLGGRRGVVPSPLRTSRDLVVLNQAMRILGRRYYRPLTRSSLVDGGLSGMVAGLDDRYSRYLDPRAYRERRQERTQDGGGVGITTAPEARGLRVVTVVADSPAARAGLMPGDLIVKVGSTSLQDRADDVGPDLIRGPIGKPVGLTFLRGDAEHAITVERANIVVPVATRQMLTYRDRPIGYLRLTGFTDGSGDTLRREVRAVLDAHAQGLILDLRGNGGGLISEAINVASIFIARGEIMSAVERGRPRRVYMARDDAIAPRVPLVVLVDHGTASSAEIVTAALQDHDRAKIVGSRTYGKGVFQLTLPLLNRGALDITIGEFFTPDGRNLGGGGASRDRGITPDIYVKDDAHAKGDEVLAVAERALAAEVR
jgi:carboxyl-terminal processing protease